MIYDFPAFGLLSGIRVIARERKPTAPTAVHSSSRSFSSLFSSPYIIQFAIYIVCSMKSAEPDAQARGLLPDVREQGSP